MISFVPVGPGPAGGSESESYPPCSSGTHVVPRERREDQAAPDEVLRQLAGRGAHGRHEGLERYLDAVVPAVADDVDRQRVADVATGDEVAEGEPMRVEGHVAADVERDVVDRGDDIVGQDGAVRGGARGDVADEDAVVDAEGVPQRRIL